MTDKQDAQGDAQKQAESNQAIAAMFVTLQEQAFTTGDPRLQKLADDAFDLLDTNMLKAILMHQAAEQRKVESQSTRYQPNPLVEQLINRNRS